MSPRSCLIIASILGGLGVALGAFGAHALPNIVKSQVASDAELAKRQEWFEIGVRYHMYHALALFALAATARGGATSFTIAAGAWLLGIVVFCGCLYAMAFTGLRVLGAVVPLGGLAFLVGWASCCVAVWRTSS